MDFDRIAKEAFRALDIHHPKDEQLQAVRALVLDKKNVFVQLPTGFGKSACFQVLPLICDLLANKTKYHVVLVITPLIAISQDQVDTLTKLGIDACSWSDTHTDMETTSKGAQIIFTTPEALIGVTGKEKNPKGLSLVSTEKFRKRCVCVALDEAHCCLKWEGFRPVYGHLSRVTAILGDTPVMALTATSTPIITKFLEKNFLGSGYAHFKADPTRSNIKLTERALKEADQSLAQLLWDLREMREAFPRTLVFFRSLVDYGDANVKVRRFLQDHGVPTTLYASYHSLHEQVRLETTLRDLKDHPAGGIRLIFATSAFGMGVNVPGITRVWHVEPPTQMDDLVQQVGRAARGADETAIHTLFFSGNGLRDVAQNVRTYVLNKDTCRRKALAKALNFGEEGEVMSGDGVNPESCCDVCDKMMTE